MEREAERGGEERGREAVSAGATGSQRASRSGLLSRGTGVMSLPDVNHASCAPAGSTYFSQWLSDSEIEGRDLGRGGVNSRGGASAAKGEGEEGRAIDLTS